MRLFTSCITAFVFIIATTTIPIMAQQPASASPEMQAIANKLMVEINAGIQCAAATIAIRQDLEKAQAEIKRLTDKYESKIE